MRRDFIWLAIILGLALILALSLAERQPVAVDDHTLPPPDGCRHELPAVGSPAWIVDDSGRELPPVEGDPAGPALRVDGSRPALRRRSVSGG